MTLSKDEYWTKILLVEKNESCALSVDDRKRILGSEDECLFLTNSKNKTICKLESEILNFASKED